MSAVNLRVEAPLRPTDWRWEKAKLMREDPRTASLLRHQDDEWTRKAKKFQEQLDSAGDEYDNLLLIRKWPAVWDAFNLREETSERRLVRYQLEARLLAGEPFRDISKKTDLPEDTIFWYEKLFFNVLDKLDAEGWICHCVLGESAQAGLTERDYDVLWKLYGYKGGPVVLDVMINKNSPVSRPEGIGQWVSWARDDIECVNAMKMNLAMRTMPVNSYTAEKIAEIYQRFQELKKMADGSGGAGDMLTSNILVMMKSMGWAIGEKTVMVLAENPKAIVGRLHTDVIAADEGAVELRADELMQINTGHRPARLQALPEVRFPEKDNATAAQ